MRTRWRFLFLVSGIFLLAFVSLAFRVGRFVDEDIAIAHGQFFLDALFSQNSELQRVAASADSGNSIGIPVTLLAGVVFRFAKDILAVHLAMGIWFYFFIFAVLFFADAVFSTFLDARHSASLFWVRRLFIFCVACFVQALPNSYVNQTFALSEFPGGACVLFGLAFALRKEYKLSQLFFGLAPVFKVYYILFIPLGILIEPLLGRKSVSVLLRAAIVVFIPLFILQIVKWVAFGTQHYLASWVPYWGMLVGQSGLSKTAPVGVNEFPNYSWRTQAYWYIGSYGPLVFTALLAAVARFRNKNLKYLQVMSVLSVLVFVGAFQWQYLAIYKWWRRAYPFLIPGYSLAISAFLLILIVKITQIRVLKVRFMGFLGLLLLALYVQGRQTIVGVIQNNPVIGQNERTIWKAP